MIQFLIGGIFTVVIFTLGMALGYVMGYRLIEQKIVKHQQAKAAAKALEETPQIPGGPVKQISPQELARSKNKAFTDRLEELVGK